MDDTTLRKPGEGAQKEVPMEKKTETGADQPKVDNNAELAQKLKETADAQAKTDAEIKAMKTEQEFGFIASQYPHATEFKDKILEKVAQGMSVADASVLVLHQNEKLIKRDDMERDEMGRASMGGSAPTQMPGSANQKVNDAVRKMNTPGAKITEAELGEIQSTLREALAEEERKGTFQWVPD